MTALGLNSGPITVQAPALDYELRTRALSSARSPEEFQSHLELVQLQHVEAVADVVFLVEHEKLALFRTHDRRRPQRVVPNVLRRNLLHEDDYL